MRASAAGMIQRSASMTRCAYWIAINGDRNSAFASSKFSLSTCETYSGANLIECSISVSRPCPMAWPIRSEFVKPSTRVVRRCAPRAMPVQASGSVETDLALFDRIARRDASAVGELYDRHSRVLHGLIWRILRDTNEAEEVLQDVFVRVWKRADTYDAVLGTPLAWLVRIARNRAIDRLRARRARPIDTADDEMLATIRTDEATAPSPERLARTSEQGRAVRAALDRLVPEQRVLIEHAFFLGFTQSELAERFGLPLGTVKTRVRAGMLAMREHLQDVV